RQQQDQIQRNEQHRGQLGVRRPGRRREKIFLQNGGHGMRQRQHRRHIGRHRRGEGVADTGGGGADQHNLVAESLGRNAPDQYVHKRRNQKRRLAVAVVIKEVVHLQAGRGGNAQIAERDAFAERNGDVFGPQIQAFGRQRQREG